MKQRKPKQQKTKTPTNHTDYCLSLQFHRSSHLALGCNRRAGFTPQRLAGWAGQSSEHVSMNGAVKTACPPEACGLRHLLRNSPLLQVNACLLRAEQCNLRHCPQPSESGVRPHVNKRKNSKKGMDRQTDRQTGDSPDHTEDPWLSPIPSGLSNTICYQ